SRSFSRRSSPNTDWHHNVGADLCHGDYRQIQIDTIASEQIFSTEIIAKHRLAP
ncbi:hypothetical protein RRG08_062171, partial [Elysia crispata]